MLTLFYWSMSLMHVSESISLISLSMPCHETLFFFFFNFCHFQYKYAIQLTTFKHLGLTLNYFFVFSATSIMKVSWYER